jgi:hypothetical protein
MNFLLVLAQQPLFRLLGAFLVLLVTDMKPVYGFGAGLVWLTWVYLGTRVHEGRRVFF